MKRILASLIALTLLLTLAVGAGAEAGDLFNLDGTMPIAKEGTDYTFRVAVVDNSMVTKPYNDMVMVKKMQELTGIKFEWELINPSSAAEKINLMIASGDLPDMFLNGITDDMVGQYEEDDVFVPTEELVEQYMPNLQKVLEARPFYKAMLYSENGHTYGFPFIEECDNICPFGQIWVINKVWLDKVGKEVPTTVDEFVDCLRAFKAAGDLNGNGIDDEIPFEYYAFTEDTFGSENGFNWFTGAFGAPTYSGGTRSENFTAVYDDKVVFTANNDAYRKTAELFHQMYSEGLIGIDTFTLGTQPDRGLYYDKIAQDVAIVGALTCWTPLVRITNHDVHDEYVAIPYLEGEDGRHWGTHANYAELRTKSCCVITTACEYPEVLASWVDQLFEPYMSTMWDWGSDEAVFHYDDNGMLVYNLDENGDLIIPEEYETYYDLRMNDTPGGSGPFAVLEEYFGDVCDVPYDQIELRAMQDVNGKAEIMAEYQGVAVPQMIYNQEDQSTLSQIVPLIRQIVQSYNMQWIVDGNIDETWDAYNSELEAAGLPQLLEVLQKGYDRYLGILNESNT